MKILAIFICLVGICSAQDFGHLSDDDFYQAIESSEPIGIYFYSSQVPKDDQLRENTIKSITMSRRELETNHIRLALVNCDESRLHICEDPKKLHNVLIYKNTDVTATLNGDSFQSLLNVQINMKHYAGFNGEEIMDMDQYKDIQMQHAGMTDLVVFYIPGFGTLEHLRMLNAASTLPNSYEVYYTSNGDVVGSDNAVWLIDCILVEGDECRVSSSYKFYDDKNFMDAMQKSSLTNVLLPDQDFAVILQEMTNKGKDVLVLIAGIRKFQAAMKLAKEFTTTMGGGVHALVVNGVKIHHQEVRTRVENDKIFAMVSKAGKGPALSTNIGFLESEDLLDVIDEFQHAMQGQDETWQEVDGTPVEEESEDYMIHPEDVQDDPVAFSLHHTKHVKDLYYFDYKTLPRLTDKAYKKVINSDAYAVILFTLEFNSRALATLVTFAEIHNAYKAMGKSPMYRVECYNWPDVCENAGVYTSPRMFFYPPGTKERIEYMGMWDKVSMKEAILRYSNPSVIVVHKKEDILPYIPITVRSVVGLFKSDEGNKEFREAAELLRKDYQFIELHGEVGKFVADQYEVEYEDMRLLAFEHSFPKDVYGSFNTAQDILDFCKKAYAAPELQEINIYTFIDLLQDKKPMLIYFWDKENGNKRMYYTEIKDTLQGITSLFKEKILFTWMDASRRSTGEFVLGRYNYRSRLEQPIIAFFDKQGSVMLKSCAEECTNTSLIKWIQDCLDGKLDASYLLSTEEWNARLDGYDYLQMMKDEGTYPMKGGILNQDESKEKKAEMRGRTVKLMNKLKKTDPADPQDMMKEKKSTHEEL